MSKRKKTTSDRGKSYQHPVPKRGSILDFLREAGQPLKAEAIMLGFDLKGQRMRSLLVDQLARMVRGGQLLENRRNEYCLLEKLELITGMVKGHQDGFGFLVPDEGGEDFTHIRTSSS